MDFVAHLFHARLADLLSLLKALCFRRDKSRGRLACHAHFFPLQLEIQRLDLEDAGRSFCGLGYVGCLRFRRSGLRCGGRARKADGLGRFQDDLRAVPVKLNRTGDFHVLALIGLQRLPIEHARFPHRRKSIRRTAHAEVYESHARGDRAHAGDLAGDGYLLADVLARLGVGDGDGVDGGYEEKSAEEDS